MKSTVLVGTLAATLVSTLNAEVFVLGASWRERSITAPNGEIERKMRNAANPRAYVVMESAASPGLKCTIIEYNTDRVLGKTYKVHGGFDGFTGFTADKVGDDSESSTRIFGHIYAPVSVADVPDDSVMPFSGSVHGEFKPRHLVFDKTVFQSGTSTEAGAPLPNLFQDGTMARSILTGAANNYTKFTATSFDGIVDELTTRLDDEGYVREAMAPVIAVEPTAPVTRDGFNTATLSIGLRVDAFGVNYQWWKEAGAVGPVGDVVVASTPTYTVPAGDPGTGTYYVVVSNSEGTDTSANFVVPAPTNKAVTISAQMAATTTLTLTESRQISPTFNQDGWPRPTFRWQRSAIATPTTWVDITDANNGNAVPFTVIGDPAAPNVRGSGFNYRLRIVQGATTTDSAGTLVPVP